MFSFVTVVKRDADKSMMDSVKDMAGKIPLIGKYVSEGIQKIQDLFDKIQKMTNGGFGRVLGGALPCTADLKTGITCTGVSAKSDMSELVETMLSPIPPLVLPDIFKLIIEGAIDIFVVPLVDIFLGGVKTV